MGVGGGPVGWGWVGLAGPQDAQHGENGEPLRLQPMRSSAAHAAHHSIPTSHRRTKSSHTR